MTSTSRAQQEISRGFLLLGVFHVHALYAVSYAVGGVENAPMTWLQIKVLSPVVAAFFVLAGMGSKQLANRPTRGVLSRSLMLWLLAVISHILGVVLSHLVYVEWVSWQVFARALIRPIVYGTDYASFVPWFFTVLAVVRVLVHLLGTRPLVFLPVVVGLVALVLCSRALGLPDNFHEWRQWPVAIILFLTGMWIPDTWKAPHWMAPVGVAVWLVAGLLNSPTFLSLGPAWNREPDFVAESMVGRLGFAPVFILQVTASMVFLLWLGRVCFGTILGRILHFFGSRSLQFLFLHGVALVTVFPMATRLLPQRETIFLFLVCVAANPAIHALLYQLAKRPFRWLLGRCAGIAARLVDLALPRRSGLSESATTGA